MKKTYIISIILLAVIAISSLFYIKPLMRYIGNAILDTIGDAFDREFEKNEIKIANGEPIYGRDTCLIWANAYEIWRDNGEKLLSIETKKVSGTILEEITIYKKIDKKLYIVAKTGYAIIDEGAFCKIYVNDESLFEASGHVIKKIEDDHIKYFSEFSSFSADERKNFEKLEEKLKKKSEKQAKNEK